MRLRPPVLTPSIGGALPLDDLRLLLIIHRPAAAPSTPAGHTGAWLGGGRQENRPNCAGDEERAKWNVAMEVNPAGDQQGEDDDPAQHHAGEDRQKIRIKPVNRLAATRNLTSPPPKAPSRMEGRDQHHSRHHNVRPRRPASRRSATRANLLSRSSARAPKRDHNARHDIGISL